MTQQHPPRFAVAVLDWLGMDRSLVGDIVEEYESRGSRVWLWKQVIAAGVVALFGRAQHTGPHRWRDVRLNGAPSGAPVGGVGLVALAVLLAVVRPGAFWFAVIAVAGGVAVGAAMIVVGRRRALRTGADGRRNVLLP
jgi:hypothetical protein